MVTNLCALALCSFQTGKTKVRTFCPTCRQGDPGPGQGERPRLVRPAQVHAEAAGGSGGGEEGHHGGGHRPGEMDFLFFLLHFLLRICTGKVYLQSFGICIFLQIISFQEATFLAGTIKEQGERSFSMKVTFLLKKLERQVEVFKYFCPGLFLDSSEQRGLEDHHRAQDLPGKEITKFQ